MKFNKVTLAGYLIKDCELRQVGNKQTTLCTFCLGVQVDKERDTVFMDCTAWGKKGEVLGKYIKKGSNLFVEGRLESSSWEDKKTGQKRTKLTCNVNDFQLLDAFKAEPEADDDF